MKFIFAVIVVISFCGSLAAAKQYVYQQPQQSSAVQLPVSNLVKEQVYSVLNYIVQNVLSNVVYFLVQFVILIARSNAAINVRTLITALGTLDYLSLNTLLSAAFELIGVNGELILDVVPDGILELQIDSDNLVQFLVSSIPPGTKIVPFPLVATLIGDYISQLLSVVATQ